MSIEKYRHALVIGLGYRTGLSAANFLKEKGLAVTVSDSKAMEDLEAVAAKLLPGIEVVAGAQRESLLDRGIDVVVLSPGVPAAVPPVREAVKRGIPVISEIELAYMYLKGRIIAITGTDGKSTTTSLTGHICKELGYDTFVGGNIGIPLITLAPKTTENSVTVIELSSFQLETIDTFRPHVSAILNVAPDHMDRYDGMDDYFAAKLRIAENQGNDDLFVYNLDDAMITGVLGNIKAEKESFSLKNSSAAIYRDEGVITINENGKTAALMNEGELSLPGLHNVQNVMAAVLMVRKIIMLYGGTVDYGKIARACASFSGLEHRLEEAGVHEGRTFINDSKATTVGAVETALKSMEGPVVLIVGGRTKGDDYSRLTKSMKGKVKAVLCIGESKEMFSELYSDFNPVKVDTFDDAVKKAADLSSEGDTVLLSPACASFDMFESYEERGRAFRESFGKLTRGEL